MNRSSALLISALAIALTTGCQKESSSRPDAESSITSLFASEVVGFYGGDWSASPQHSDSDASLGAPDYDGKNTSCIEECAFVSLGKNGSITVAFEIPTDLEDVYYSVRVHEVGPLPEPIVIYVSEDGIHFEPYIPGGLTPPRYVRVTDAARKLHQNDSLGPDIDAVEVSWSSERDSKLVAWGQSVGRGLQSRPPGNSIPAIHLASPLGYDGIEIDVRATADNRLVLLHDDALSGETDGKGRVSELRLEDLVPLSRGNWWGEPVFVATLEHAFYAIGQTNMFVLVDARFSTEFINDVKRAYEQYGDQNRKLMVSAYSLEDVAEWVTLMPDARVFLKTYEPELDLTDTVLERLSALGAGGVMFPVNEETENLASLVERTHENGMELVTFVHTYGRGITGLQSQSTLGVDYILTERVDGTIR